MKSWLREDRVYQAIMNGALWLVFIAALSTTKWPELSWITGSITAVLVVIVTAVYWIAVVTNDDNASASRRQRPSTTLADAAESQRERNVVQERHLPSQEEDIVAALDSKLALLRRQNLETLEALRRKHLELLLRITDTEPNTIRASNLDELRLLRNWVVHAPHHGADFGAVRSHRRAFSTRTLVSAAVGGEDDTSGKVVVMVGSVRIEIQEDDPNKTTNVHITSPKSVVTALAGTEAKPQVRTPESPVRTVH
jgi:hypothetical protein